MNRVGLILLATTICQAAGEPTVPRVVKAEPLPAWEANFAGKDGWIGGDGVASVVLGPKRVLWMFGDTLLGTVKEGKRTGAAMVNNTIALQAGTGPDAAVAFAAGKGKDDRPAAFFTPDDGKGGWYWPLAGVRDGERLFVFLARIDKAGKGGPFGFKNVGQALTVVANPDDEPAAWRVTQHALPFAEFGADTGRSWGSAVLADGDWLYVYGYEDRGKGLGKRVATLARVPAGKLADFAAWRFRTRDGWSEKPADAAPLADGLAAEFSVTRRPDGPGLVMVYTENGLGDRIVGRFAASPEGPWSPPVLLYRSPEMAADKGVFSYAGKAHAWAAGANELVVSYCVNTWDFGRLFRDEAVYRPKFVRVVLGPQ